MKTHWILTLAWIGLVAPLAQAAEEKALTDKKQKVSYTLGYNIGNIWKRQEILLDDLDIDTLMRGMKEAQAGIKGTLSDQELQETAKAFQMELRAKQEEKRRKLGEKNKAESATFLAENKTKPGVVTLPSGLQYKVISEGAGPIPKSNDTVVVHYRGTLIDGTQFDTSIGKDPASFRTDGVIKGWSEALQLMKVGSKWQLFVPSELGYGERGAGPNIGPSATLIFDVELLSIKSQEPSQPIVSDIIKVPSADELKKGAKIEVIKQEDLSKQQKQEK